MARRTLSTKGRILAAGMSVAVGGALVGLMADGDHTADASGTSSGSSVGLPSQGQDRQSQSPSATPFGDRGSGPSRSGSTGTGAQPQTRTGGS